MPISDCEVRDPRIRRTRQLLQGALRTLMQTRSFEEISVQEIAETATVNRATFYDHYTDKFALLDALVAGGFHQLLHERNVQFDPGCPARASVIIVTVCDYLVLSHEGNSCTGQSPFEPLIDAAIIGAIRRVLARGLERPDQEPPNHSVPKPASLLAEMTTAAASNAIYGAAQAWFKTKDRPTVEAITPQILALVFPILGAGREAPPKASKDQQTAEPLAQELSL
jgi:AcrR family transcriptional regulator